MQPVHLHSDEKKGLSRVNLLPLENKIVKDYDFGL
jgi:hypothetical protein